MLRMNKKVDGLTLLRMIRDGEIEENTLIRNEDEAACYNSSVAVDTYTIHQFMHNEFEILQDDKCEKIEKLEEMNRNADGYSISCNSGSLYYTVENIENKLNEVIDVVNELKEGE